MIGSRKIGLIVVVVSILYLLNILQFWQFSCSRLGYTLCAAIGEDFQALYQAGKNFETGHFIYGKSAQEVSFTNDYFPWKYLPILPILISPLTEKVSFETLYRSFVALTQAMILILGLTFIYKIGIILKKEKWQIILSVGLYWLFWSFQSDWRMGQFNSLAGLFFLIFFWGVVSKKNGLLIFGWIGGLILKPIFVFGIFHYIKRRGWKAIFWFLGVVIVTLFYFKAFSLDSLITSLQKTFGFLTDKDRIGWQIHYIDNFGVSAFFAELFYDKFRIVYKASSFVLTFIAGAVPIIYLIKNKNHDRHSELYFLLLLALSPFIFYKEIWESLLAFLAPIVALAFLLSKHRKEKIFVFLIWLFLATPTLYFFWQKSDTQILRKIMIAQKALPIMLLYIYLTIKTFQKKQTSQNFYVEAENYADKFRKN